MSLRVCSEISPGIQGQYFAHRRGKKRNHSRATVSIFNEACVQKMSMKTGRNIKFKLYPLSVNEIKQKNTWLWVMENLNNLLVYGSYPGIIDLNISDKQIKLPELASDYLFKDVLIHENIKNPALIRKLLKALALQIGSQVSTNELSNMLGVTRQTISL